MSWLGIAGVIWGLLAVVLLALVTYRSIKASREDDSVRLVGGDVRIDEQAEFVKKMEKLEKWAKALAVILVVYGLAVLVYWGYTLM